EPAPSPVRAQRLLPRIPHTTQPLAASLALLPTPVSLALWAWDCPRGSPISPQGGLLALSPIHQRRSQLSPNAICNLPADPGPCEAYMPSYFYNSATKRCEQFIYGGCQGNANRFPSVNECLKTCGSSGKTARETQLVGSGAGQRDVNAKQLGPQRRISPRMTDWLHHSSA
uniref:BPTI/Kunitz inhibitor domain-containing protein n=1 Tax=Chrysemys picta bellii TaxID=8478 RepID=A0A8C3IXU9_CHRPI